jgi:two-component system phosphate regulon response regulator PhoB
MHSILVVEDAPDFQLMIKHALTSPAYRLSCVETVFQAIKNLKTETFDLVLLDIGLPDGDGYQICTQMQSEERTKNIPVFFLTGKTDVYDKVMAFSMGADDYIVKPFDPRELKARIDAKLSKKKNRVSAEETFKKGALKISLGMQKAFSIEPDGKEIDLRLTPAEFKLLNYLIKNEGKLCSRAKLLSDLWGNDVHVLDHNVYTHVCALRRKLGKNSKYVHSVPRQGYRFSVG